MSHYKLILKHMKQKIKYKEINLGGKNGGIALVSDEDYENVRFINVERYNSLRRIGEK